MPRLGPTGVASLVTTLKNWVISLLNNKANTSHTHATSDITDLPTIPTKVSDLTNDSGFLTTHNPVDSSLSSTSTNAVQNNVIYTELNNKADSSHTHTVSDVSDFPTLATVATSGSYNDLSNKPTIPTVNNATLTIQKNGTAVQTFTANASSNVTANITVPTAVSELTNDSGFLSNTLTNNTDKGALGWSSSIGTNIPTLNTLAYWNGAYTSTASNLAYCIKGAFGDIVTHNASEFLTSHQSLSDYVTLNSSQTLTSTKSFTTNIDTANTATTSRESWRINFTKDDTNGSNAVQIGTIQFANTGNFCTLMRVANPRSANKPTSGDGVNTGNCWSGIGVLYDFSLNKGYPFAYGCSKWADSSNNDEQLASTSWVRTYCETTKGFLTSHQSLSNYSTKANTVKSLSISGKTITVTPGSGSAYTLTTQDTVYTHPTTAGNKHIPSGGSSGQFLGWSSDGTAKWVNNPNTNTDTLMTQNVSTTNATYPVLLVATADATANQGAKTGIFAKSVKVNPSTNVISASGFSGPLTGNVTGNCSGTAANVTGTVAIANGGTGATTRLNAVKALTNENVGTNATYFITITDNWGKAGYCSVANAKTVLGLKSAAYTESSAYAAASHTHSNYLTAHQSLSNYSTLANTVKSLSISGKTITVTPGSGNAYTLTTQDTVYTHPTSAGNKHIPSGGSSGQILKYSSSGTATWADPVVTRTFAQIATRTSSGTWTISGVTANTIIYVVGTVTASGASGSTDTVKFTSGVAGESMWGCYDATSSGGFNNMTFPFFIAAFATATSVKVSITHTGTGSISAVSLKAYQ